jgi:hypothetical protein
MSDAEDRAEQIEHEDFQTPEQEADISRRMDAVQNEIVRLQQEVQEAHDDWSRTADHWGFTA